MVRSVQIPFTLLFTGFEPHASGTVVAYSQPGGQQVGSADVTVDALGVRCLRVVGDAAPGQYKLVYDFGSGTGKQKVVTVEPGPSPTASSSQSEPATGSEEPTATDTATSTGSEVTTISATPTEPLPTDSSATVSQTPSPSLTPTPPESGSSAGSTTPSNIPSEGSGTSTSSTGPAATTGGENYTVEFEPLPDSFGDEAAGLPKTGADAGTQTLAILGVLLAAGGAILIAITFRLPRGRHG
jgi:LPXTG-motif cell wall-anchored protein